MSQDDAVVKRMAQLLKQGATMLSSMCPNCHVPLFRLKSGEVFCPKCNQRFLIVSSEEEELMAYESLAISELERAVAAKLAQLCSSLTSTNDIDELDSMLSVIHKLLSALKLARELKGSLVKTE